MIDIVRCDGAIMFLHNHAGFYSSFGFLSEL